MKGWLENVQNEMVVAYSRHCPNIWLQGQKNTQKNLKIKGIKAEN
jgi:hypothetical protein